MTSKLHKPEQPVSDLVDQAYSIATNPEQYDQLVMAWEKRISSVVRHHGLTVGGREHAIDSGVDQHLLRAFEIVERLDEVEASKLLSLSDFLAAYTGPALLVRPDGSVRCGNTAAEISLGVTTDISQISMDSDMVNLLRERLTANRIETTGIQSVLRAYDKDGRSLVLVLSPYHRPHDEPLTLILTAEINWTYGVDRLLQEGFSLTLAETAVTNAIMLGYSISEIAERNQKSINTIRSQLSSVLHKTGATKQSDLVRLIAGISQIAASEASRGRKARKQTVSDDIPSDVKEHVLIQPDGRKIAYRLIGPENGRWALFSHGMLTGPYLPPLAKQRLHHHNIKLLAVARPGFGETCDVLGSRTKRHQQAALDLKAVMAHLGTGPCVLLGQEAGGVQGYAMAHFQPSLILAQVNFSSGIPFTRPEHIAKLPPRMRGFMWTARLAPQILPLMIRGAISLFLRGRLNVFHKTFYHGEGLDFEVSQQAEASKLLQKGAEFSHAQGQNAILQQTIDLSVDWSDYLINFKHPTVLIHGHQNSQFPWHFVQYFAKEHQNVSFIGLKDAGLLLIHTHGELIIDTLHQQMSDLGL